MRVNLTERFAKRAMTEGRKSPIFYDDEVIGFGFRSGKVGKRSQDPEGPRPSAKHELVGVREKKQLERNQAEKRSNDGAEPVLGNTLHDPLRDLGSCE